MRDTQRHSQKKILQTEQNLIHHKEKNRKEEATSAFYFILPSHTLVNSFKERDRENPKFILFKMMKENNKKITNLILQHTKK